MTTICTTTDEFAVHRYRRASTRDQHHRASLLGWKALTAPHFRLVSTTHVFDEVVTLLARRLSPTYAAEWGERHMETKLITWVDEDVNDRKTALRMVKKFGDQAVSFTDCVSLAVMKRLKIQFVFGFDSHFELAGFRFWSP